MGPHHGMEADRFAPVGVLAHLGRAVRVHAGLCRRPYGRYAHAQAFERALQPIRQAFVGEILVCEMYPAIGHYFNGIQDGAKRRLRYQGGVGTSVLANDLLIAGFALVSGEHLALDA